MPASPPLQPSSCAASVSATCAAHSLTVPQFHLLREHAVAAKAGAHCPYSNFRVGAAVLAADGSVTTGANVENASYPVGTCAERVALGTAATRPRPPAGPFRAVAVAVATDTSPPASPCGMCRQFIREFSSLDVPIVMFDGEGKYVVATLDELLPLSFGPENLGRG
ncbi:uncharacterized protein UV8b_02088 [Ustilaginoidea virens]|uniref:Cytidine deaminase n=1 Tax=Ustilaginoidea virens TaxID=1159556 RepID=A0A8E5HM50_USTVR|nr:uncharacterized protein UV8b_02088 [Ustilaginoidea virens]QUC17847.1 hypothetical protein UV8b_02088 [Ustilaginoidea virens]